jgi:hypothetical protein
MPSYCGNTPTQTDLSIRTDRLDGNRFLSPVSDRQVGGSEIDTTSYGSFKQYRLDRNCRLVYPTGGSGQPYVPLYGESQIGLFSPDFAPTQAEGFF